MQTAVLDNAESEEPVELPAEAVDLELFRAAHVDRTFWCGLWLGGCGGRLTTRLCTDKICHFAHLPDQNAPDSPCHRINGRTSGSGSADHLYIKAALADWMTRHGLSGNTHFLRDPAGEVRLGAQVTAEPQGHEPLRFILDNSAMAGTDALDTSTIFGPGIEPDPRLLHTHGYAHRVRCVSDGAHRKTQIGTQGSDGTIDWYDFTADHVRLTPEGLSTPAVAEIRRQRIHTVPIGVRARRPAEDTTVEPWSYPAVPDKPENRTELVENLRKALADGVSVTPLQRHLDRLEAATRQGATAEETSLIQRASDVLLRLRRGVGVPAPAPNVQPRGRKTDRRTPATAPVRPWADRPDRLVPAPAPAAESAAKSARDQARNGPRQKRQTVRAAVRQVRSILYQLSDPGSASDDDIHKLKRDLATAFDTAGEKLSSSERRKVRAWIDPPRHPVAPAPSSNSGLSAERLRSAATAVRGALKKAARERKTTSWSRLQHQLGSALPQMTAAERIEVLTLAERQTPTDQPLLCSLVAVGDPSMAGAYRKVAAALGLEVPLSDDDLCDVLEADTEQVHQHWHHG
ncbi:hypothetical protein [Streptomyces niveus]|uniref:hypothetical protein n=1 Tax=Streptomyces niveus TaxID=193462 RepID=UPI0036D39A98